MLMWHEDPVLRDVVVMDPISFFISPATLVICKHKPTDEDPVYHSAPIHDKARRFFKDDFDDMVGKGLVSSRLLDLLLEDSGSNREYVIKMMLKYGLITRLLQRRNGSFEISYLVPSLLPDMALPSTNISDMAFEWPADSYRTFYFGFSASEYLEKQGVFSWSDLRGRGYLPIGLFERLICKTVNHSQLTLDFESTDFNMFSIYKNVALLSYGNQQFQLRNLSELNCIRVDVKGRNPIAIYRRLRDQLKSVIEECMKSLRLFSTLLITQGNSSYHVTMNQLEKASATSQPIYLGAQTLSSADLKSMYPEWFSANVALSRYDVFLSYRWSKFDSAFVQILFDRLTLYTVDSKAKRCIDTFLDEKRLRKGRNFQEEFANALISTRIVAPLISQNSLTRLTMD